MTTDLLIGLVRANLAAAVAWLQARFLRSVRRGEAGPALVGVLFPRLVVPRDYESRFTAGERRLIRAHERRHIERRDPRVNAVMALVQAVCWFNPAIHL